MSESDRMHPQDHGSPEPAGPDVGGPDLPAEQPEHGTAAPDPAAPAGPAESAHPDAPADPATGPIRVGADDPSEAPSPWQSRPSGALASPHGFGPGESSPWQRPTAAHQPGPHPAGHPGARPDQTRQWPVAEAWTAADPGQRPGQPGAHPRPPLAPPAGAWPPPGTGRWPGAAGPGTADGRTTGARTTGGHGARSTLVVLAVAVLALVAGFGGGLLGTRIGGSQTADGQTDPTLTQHTATQPASDSTPAPSGSVQAVADKVLPSVVSVVALSGRGEDEGSGVILTESGLILTNNHVIDGAKRLTVQFNDGTTGSASVVGTDPTDDLAVIKVSGVSGLTPATLGTSADLQVGQQVVAVGSPLGLSATVTTGIVSALDRPIRTSSPQGSDDQDTVLNAIQTDAPINPGNSGGPLVDMNGYVIGINSAIATLSTGAGGQSGSIGVGFAIPIDQAHRIAQEIIDTGEASHAVLGATVRDATDRSRGITTGALIVSVTKGGGAAKAGIKAGDVITEVGDAAVESADALVASIRSSTPGGKVRITYTRDGESSTVTVHLGSSTD